MEPNRFQKTAPEYRSDDRPPVEDEPTIVSENRARQAVPLGHMRYVLAISLALVVGGFAIFFWFPWG